jgi:hypothetical protein
MTTLCVACYAATAAGVAIPSRFTTSWYTLRLASPMAGSSHSRSASIDSTSQTQTP